MKQNVVGEWKGWDGKTVVKLSDGTKWKQAEYYYEYMYAYMPEVQINQRSEMQVAGMSRAVQVQQVFG
jgi:hypothetical protein